MQCPSSRADVSSARAWHCTQHLGSSGSARRSASQSVSPEVFGFMGASRTRSGGFAQGARGTYFLHRRWFSWGLPGQPVEGLGARKNRASWTAPKARGEGGGRHTRLWEVLHRLGPVASNPSEPSLESGILGGPTRSTRVGFSCFSSAGPSSGAHWAICQRDGPEVSARARKWARRLRNSTAVSSSPSLGWARGPGALLRALAAQFCGLERDASNSLGQSRASGAHLERPTSAPAFLRNGPG